MDEEKKVTEQEETSTQPVQENTVAAEEETAVKEEPVPEEKEESAEQPQEEQPQQSAEKSPDELAAEISENISAEEKARMIAAQQKADKRYHAVFGDRRIKKPSRLVAIVITVVILLLLGIYLIIKLPMFYNCMTPGSTDTIKNLLQTYQGDYSSEKKYYNDVTNDDEVWLNWYDYNDGTVEFTDFLNAPVSKEIFANAEDLTEDYAQTNFFIAKKASAEKLKEDSEFLYVTVIMYKFDGTDQSAEYAERKKEELGGQFEKKNLLFFQLGMVQATLENGFYSAWYNGGTYVEIYASNEDLTKEIKTKINALS